MAESLITANREQEVLDASIPTRSARQDFTPLSVANLVVFGKCGAGKSTTLNQLFGLDFTTDDAVACTTNPNSRMLLERVRIVDLPGIGESLAADEQYWPFYTKWVPRADHLLWITQADTRAYKRDEIFLMRLKPLFKPTLRLTIGLNRVDCLGVDEGCPGFDGNTKQLSEAQLQHLPVKIQDVFSIFQDALDGCLPFSHEDIVPYSATSGWGMQRLRQRFFVEETEDDC